MLRKDYLGISKQFIFVFFISVSVLLIACDNGSETPKVADVKLIVPILTDANIKQFTVKMAEDYNANLGSLMAGFKAAKKAGNEYQFVNFRNHTWTPNYIEQKDYYQKVLENNASYLAHSPSEPLFELFESLIYTGITLKNVLLEHDDAKLQAQLSAIENDKKIVNSIVK
tara:strand:+ start:23735 stop:24244 length:510 start_codon:yes stop_codon:yes gene_type:complete